MLNRYGLGIIGLIGGLLIMWGLFGFKNPFASSATTEGVACMTADNKAGTIKAGVCVAK